MASVILLLNKAVYAKIFSKSIIWTKTKLKNIKTNSLSRYKNFAQSEKIPKAKTILHLQLPILYMCLKTKSRWPQIEAPKCSKWHESHFYCWNISQTEISISTILFYNYNTKEIDNDKVLTFFQNKCLLKLKESF